jgi:hypothetical protein
LLLPVGLQQCIGCRLRRLPPRPHRKSPDENTTPVISLGNTVSKRILSYLQDWHSLPPYSYALRALTDCRHRNVGYTHAKRARNCRQTMSPVAQKILTTTLRHNSICLRKRTFCWTVMSRLKVDSRQGEASGGCAVEYLDHILYKTAT